MVPVPGKELRVFRMGLSDRADQICELGTRASRSGTDSRPLNDWQSLRVACRGGICSVCKCGLPIELPVPRANEGELENGDGRMVQGQYIAACVSPRGQAPSCSRAISVAMG
jgi:hypothetical protein